MGIRYYAYPLDDQLVEEARAEPRAFLGEDPLMDAWDRRCPDMCYLDKAWSGLKILLGGELGNDEAYPPWAPCAPRPMAETSQAWPRPAYGLLAGLVTLCEHGWNSVTGVRDAAEVTLIAEDLSTVGRRDVDELFASPGSPFTGRILMEPDYIYHRLQAAQEATRRWADEGKALVYLIG